MPASGAAAAAGAATGSLESCASGMGRLGIFITDEQDKQAKSRSEIRRTHHMEMDGTTCL